MARIYLASPYGFTLATRGFLEDLKRALRSAGHKVTDPWELPKSLSQDLEAAQGTQGEDRRQLLHKVSLDMGEFNQAALDSSEDVVAVLDGSDVDSGTASEVGYAYARGKRIIGFRSDIRRTGENEGVIVNLQVQYWIERSGGQIVGSVAELLKSLPEKSTPR